MSVELVTGHTGAAHVTSAQDGRLNAALFAGSVVLSTGNAFAITVDSANSVTVSTGDAVMEGRHITSETPTQLTVDSGTQGMSRNDVVCLHYAKANSGVESATMEIMKGAETSGTPEDPELPSGSVLDGDSECWMPLWRLPIVGISLEEPVQLFRQVPAVSMDVATPEKAGLMSAADKSKSDLIAIGQDMIIRTRTMVNGLWHRLVYNSSGVLYSQTSSNGTTWTAEHTFERQLKSGDTLYVACDTAGYVTNAGKDVHFIVPMAETVKSGTTVSLEFASGQGLVVRQQGGYAYGSATGYARPASVTCYVRNGYVTVICSFSNAANAYNNYPAGIAVNGTLRFS